MKIIGASHRAAFPLCCQCVLCAFYTRINAHDDEFDNESHIQTTEFIDPIMLCAACLWR